MLVLVFNLSAWIVGCAHRQVKPSARYVTLFVSSELSPLELAKVAGLVQSVRATMPVIWVNEGRVEVGDLFSVLSDGAVELSLLSAAGVDAEVVGPEWLEFGPTRLRQLTDQARCWFLSANLFDTLGLPICHPWMVKNVGGTNIGITALFSDSLDWHRYQHNVQLKNPDYAAKNVSGMLADRSELKIIFLTGGQQIKITGYDLTITNPKHTVTRYDLMLVDKQLNDVRKTEINLDEIAPAQLIQVQLDSVLTDYRQQAEQTVVETRVKISPRILRKVVLDGLLSLRIADAIVYDTSRLVLDTIFPGTITLKQLAGVLSEPGHWAVVKLEGAQIRALGNSPGLRVEQRKNLPGNRLMARKIYRVLLPLSLLKRQPDIYQAGFELSPLPLFQYAADILQAQGKR